MNRAQDIGIALIAPVVLTLLMFVDPNDVAILLAIPLFLALLELLTSVISSKRAMLSYVIRRWSWLAAIVYVVLGLPIAAAIDMTGLWVILSAFMYIVLMIIAIPVLVVHYRKQL